MEDDVNIEEILSVLKNPQPQKTELEFRLYYNEKGEVITYTSEKIPGTFIVITKEQFSEARSDVLVKDEKIIYTHKKTHHFKLTKNKNQGVKTSKYDVNILTDIEYVYWNYEPHQII